MMKNYQKKIKIGNREYLYDNYNKWYFYGKTTEDMFISKDRLNDEVEIIEDDKEGNKIKKLEGSTDISTSLICRLNNIEVKINEIVDKINE